MSKYYVYSFEDTNVTISHPNYGSFSAYGTGIGSVSVQFTNNVTEHQVAADAAVIISKINAKNGTINFNVLQTSELNEFLKGLTSYLEASDPSEFALAKIDIDNKSTGDKYHAEGVSHTKKASNAFGSTAQARDWEFMAAWIDTI